MAFTEIDMKNWERAQTFRFFGVTNPTEFSVTSELDVTDFVAAVKENGYKFFPAFMWAVTREINKQKELRTTESDGKLGYYDKLCAGFPVFHEETKTITNLWIDCSDDFSEYCREYEDIMEKFGGNTKRFFARRDLPTPPNTFVLSCIPWLNFTHFSTTNISGKPHYLPSVDSGKYVEKNGRLMMPISITVHHAVTDGYHVSVFFEGLQKTFDTFKDLI